MREYAMEVYGSRWVSRSSKPLRGGPCRRGWVRLPYASATECKRLWSDDVFQWNFPAAYSKSLAYDTVYDIHDKRQKTTMDFPGLVPRFRELMASQCRNPMSYATSRR